MEVGEEGPGPLNLQVWDLELGLGQTTIPEIKFNEIQDNEGRCSDEFKQNELEIELKTVIEANECFNAKAVKVQEIDTADAAPITVQKIDVVDPSPITVLEIDTADPTPIPVQKIDVVDSSPMTVQEIDTADPVQITVQEIDTADPVQITVQEIVTAVPIPITVQENDTTDPIPTTEVDGLGTRCEIPISPSLQEPECTTPKTILVKVQDTEVKFQKNLEDECISPVVQTVKDIILEVEESEKVMERSTVAMDPAANVPFEFDTGIVLHPEAMEQIEAEMTDPMSQPLSQSKTLETLVKVKEILMEFIEVDPIQKDQKSFHESFDTASEFEYFTPEEDAKISFQLTYECEESEADSTVLEVDLENIGGEVVQGNTPEDTTFTKAITSSPDITSSQCIGPEKLKEPKLKYEIASQELVQIPNSHDFGNFTDYFQMRNVETSITPGRFKPETTERDTDMDIQMVDTASLTIDIDKLVEDLVFSGACSETLIETGDLGQNADMNLSQEIQYTDDTNSSTKLEVKAPKKEPKPSSSADKSSTKRKHTVNFTRCNPRVYEEDFNEPILSSESFIPKKKAMKENATPVLYTTPCKPFIPYLRVGLSKRTRPRQPLHENVVIKTYPDPVSKEDEDSEVEEEEQL